MTDQGQGPTNEPGSDPAPKADLTAGAILRNAREAAGLHIGALAVSLKVPVKKLEALEADQFDLLPDAVFARALAASVCRTLKIDAQPVLTKLPLQAAPKLRLEARVGQASFDTPGMGWRLPLLSRLPRPVLVTAGILVVAALALFFAPPLERTDRAATPGGAGVAPATKSAMPSAVTAPVPASVAVAVVPTPMAAASAAMAPASAAPSAAAPAAGASASRVERKAEALDPGAGVVVFKARATSWVEVTDANGVVQLRKTLAGGESAGASGALPLTVVVGRVDATEVTVRGQSFDLAALTRDNVARFQVK